MVKSVGESLREFYGDPSPGPTAESKATGEPPVAAEEADVATTVLSQVATDETPRGADESAGPEEDGDGEESGKPKGKEPLPAWADDRIKRRTRQRDQANERAAKLEQELAIAKAELAKTKPADGIPPAPADANNPVAGLNDVNEIAKMHQKAKDDLEVLGDLLEELPHNPERIAEILQAGKFELPEYTVEAMRSKLKELRDQRRVVVAKAPERIKFLREENEFIRRAAAEVMPEIIDTKSERHAKLVELVGAFPELRKRPDWAFQGSIYLLGLEALAEKQAKGKTAAPAAVVEKPKIPPAPRIPGPASSQPGRVTDQARTEAIRQRAVKPNATREDVIAAIAATMPIPKEWQ